MQPTSTRAGMIGLGAMGFQMARHMADKGLSVAGYDIAPEPMQRAHNLGIKLCASPAEVGAHAEVVVVMVATDAQVEAVVQGDDGILAGAEPGHIIVVCSSVNPHLCQRLADKAAEKQISLLDAPVVFGLAGAIEGKLKALVGGPEDIVEKVRPVLSAFCVDVIHMGPVGNGQITKTCNNMLHWTMIVANYEVLSLAKRFNIHPARMREVCDALHAALDC